MNARLFRSIVFGIFLLVLGVGVKKLVDHRTPGSSHEDVARANVAKAVKGVITSAAVSNLLPPTMDLVVDDKLRKGRIQYSIHNDLQKDMEGLFNSYGPDYGAFVALDPQTGRVLSLVSYSRSGLKGNMALRASFPSASVFKVVTAAAAVDTGKASINTVIPFNGRNHTLYRGQVMESRITHWTRFLTLREAFGKSINTVFGKLGAFSVGSAGLKEYADRFGFNRKIAGELPVEEGKALIPTDEDSWGLAETASGYTLENTMSPLQGALIAASVANQGIMMEPYIVQSVTGENGESFYEVHPKVARVTMDAPTAVAIRALMKETVLHGTSHGSFRGFFKKDFADLDVGGKTGSLTGHDPQGKYDWFVGYADSGSNRLAVAALTIHEKKWRVKSSYLARKAIESYFSRMPKGNQSPAEPNEYSTKIEHSTYPNPS